MNHKILVRRKHSAPQPGRGGYQKSEWRNEYIPVKDLKVGDTIVTLKSLPESGVEYCPTRRLSVGFMEFCGHLLGNGTVNTYGVSIARDNNAPYMDYYREVMQDEFVSFVQFTHNTAAPQLQPVHLVEEDRQTRFASVIAARELKTLGLSGNAHTKHIPDWVFKTTEELRLAFLRGFLDADGSVCKKGRIEYFSVNKGMLSQLRHLCMSVGVPVTNIGKLEHVVTLPNGEPYNATLYTFTCSDPLSNRKIWSHTPIYQKRLLNGKPFLRFAPNGR